MRAWISAARPRTLTAAFSPILLASSVAYYNYKLNLFVAIIALFCAICIQIGTNFVNDAVDCLKGADSKDRLGPARMAASGLISPRRLFLGAGVVFAFAFVSGLYLVNIAGWPILVLGIISIICGIAYTAGPLPLAYLGLGDIFVFIFFGLAAVVGTYYLQALSLNQEIWFVASLAGFQGVTLIAINNTRDIPTDIKVNKNTFSVRLGEKYARFYTAATVLIPFALVLILIFAGILPMQVLLVLLVSPIALKLANDILRAQGMDFNPLLARAALVQLAFSTCFTLSMVWGRHV